MLSAPGKLAVRARGRRSVLVEASLVTTVAGCRQPFVGPDLHVVGAHSAAAVAAAAVAAAAVVVVVVVAVVVAAASVGTKMKTGF